MTSLCPTCSGVLADHDLFIAQYGHCPSSRMRRQSVLRFLAGPAVRQPGHRELFHDVWRAYQQFAIMDDLPTLGRNKFGWALDVEGIVSVVGSQNVRYREGIKIIR